MAKNGLRQNSKKGRAQRLLRALKLAYLRVLRIDDPPEKIARGAAIGVLMGVFPTFGAGTLLSLGLAFAFKANKTAAVLGSFVVNPITAPFFFTLSVAAGSIILMENPVDILAHFKNEPLMDGLKWATVVYMVGNLAICAISTFGSYYAVKAAIIRYRTQKAERRRKGRERYNAAH